MKRTWTPATVGCHWFASDRQLAISTIAYAPVDHYPSATYGVWVDRELVADFPSLKAAQKFADDAFPVIPKTPVITLRWERLHRQSKQEIVRRAGFQPHIADMEWSEIEPWMRHVLCHIREEIPITA